MSIVIGLVAIVIVLFIIFKLARRAANNSAAKRSVQILVLLQNNKKGLTIDEIVKELKGNELARGIIVNSLKFLLDRNLVTGPWDKDLASLATCTSRFVITPKGRREIAA